MNNQNRKILVAAIVLGLSAVAHAKPPVPLDQPGYLFCADGGEYGPIETEWEDVSDGSGHYGGDLEMTVDYVYNCDGGEYYDEGSLNLEIGLSKSGDDPYSYWCDGAECYGEMSSSEFYDIWVGELYADLSANCGGDGGEIVDGSLSPLVASVKQIDPGKNKGRQNYTKIEAECIQVSP